MATIYFYPKKERSGNYSIYCKISHGTNKYERRGIGYAVSKLLFWDKKKQRAKTAENSTDINSKISSWESRFSEYAGKFKRDEIDFSISEAFSYISSGKLVKKRASTLSDIHPEFVIHIGKITQEDNAKHYKTAFKDLDEYEKFIDYSHKVTDVNTEFYLEYGLYLAEEKNNINSTINRKIGRIRTLMEWAFEKDYIQTQKYAKTFYFKNHESGRFPLRDSEIEILRGHVPETTFQKLILKAFLFACETGLRVSDLQQLQPRHIALHEDPDGKINYLDLTQVKGAVHNYIPLSSKAMYMLMDVSEGTVFDFKYSQSANVALKKVAKAAGLDREIEIVYNQGTKTLKKIERLHEILSFHFARNTYISLLLAKGLQPVFVKDNAGHSELTTTMIYSKQEDVTRWKETLKIQNR